MPIWRGRAYKISEFIVDKDIDMDGKKLTGLGAGAAKDDSVRKGEAEILLADLESAVCSEAEAAALIAAHAAIPYAHHTPPTFTEVWSGETSPESANGWENWDVSAVVPAQATAILVNIRNGSGQAKSNGVRTDGDGTSRAVLTGINDCRTQVVLPGAARILERYAESYASAATTRVIGYWS